MPLRSMVTDAYMCHAGANDCSITDYMYVHVRMNPKQMPDSPRPDSLPDRG
jgi:hypothetical protein